MRLRAWSETVLLAPSRVGWQTTAGCGAGCTPAASRQLPAGVRQRPQPKLTVSRAVWPAAADGREEGQGGRGHANTLGCHPLTGERVTIALSCYSPHWCLSLQHSTLSAKQQRIGHCQPASACNSGTLCLTLTMANLRQPLLPSMEPTALRYQGYTSEVGDLSSVNSSLTGDLSYR